MSILKLLCTFKQFEKLLILLMSFQIFNIETTSTEISWFWYVFLFFIQQILVLLTEPGVLTCQVSSVIHYLLFLLSPLNSVIGFSKLNTTRKIPQRYYFTWDAHSLHPSRYSSFIHLSISTYLASLVWPAVNALLRDPKTNRKSFKFIDTTQGGDAHQPWQHNGRFKHAF